MRRNARFSASADFVNSKGLCSPGEAVICSSACQRQDNTTVVSGAPRQFSAEMRLHTVAADLAEAMESFNATLRRLHPVHLLR